MGLFDADGTITLYCNNDGCAVRSARYEGEFPPTHCSECGARLEKTPPKRGNNTRGPRTFDSY